MKNQLFFGDCLEILEKYLVPKNPEGFIDLVYIDPPFNSKKDYNILFESVELSDSIAQKQAFQDTWSNISYIDELDRIQNLNLDLYDFLKTLEKVKTPRPAVAYLTTMSLRIIYIHKVLKSTGSFYLHCDPTMSHYLKLVCDMIFGHGKFRNEIIWSNESSSGYKTQTKSKFVRGHDVILFYSGTNSIFNLEFQPLADSTIRRYDKIDELTGEKYKIYIENDGRERRQYLNQSKGRKVSDTWTDLPSFQTVNASREWMGYPTQKPLALLERIIKTSSKPGDTVADFFCGCGTTIAAAEKLGRNWIGVDISHLAVKLIIDRLLKPWEDNLIKQKEIKDNIEITGVPKDIGSAKELARNTTKGRFNFQDWVIEFLLGGVCNPKKVGDGGYDGYITFKRMDSKRGLILIEVKSGNLTVKNIREFIQVIDKQGADMGVFVCFAENVTRNMEVEARQAGYYMREDFQERFQKIQIITIEQLLDGYRFNFPLPETTFKKATKKLQLKQIEHGDLFDGGE